MCVIVNKPCDVEPVSDEILKDCWDKNPDGAGYAIFLPNKKKWKIRKGFMKWEEFIKAWHNEHVKAKDHYVVHFRIKSAGAISAQNTHPFLICDSYGEMGRLKTTTDKPFMFHNGTCGTADGEASDTMAYIKNFIDPIMPYLSDEKISNLLTSLLLSTKDRWLLCAKDKVTRYGKWEVKDGVYYSNIFWSYKAGIGSTNLYGTDTRSYAEFEYKPIMELSGMLNSLTGEVEWDIDLMDIYDEQAQQVEAVCPNCYEDKYLVCSPYMNMGDTMCERCGCCFDEVTGDQWMYDPDIKEQYEAKLRAGRRAG